MEINIYKNVVIDGKLTDITVKDGKFADFSPTKSDGIDLKGMRVFSGLIDIHTHGCMGYDVTDNPEKLCEMSEYYAEHGITSWYPTTVADDFSKIKKATSVDVSNNKGANILGFHTEGPYISKEKKGALNEKFIKDPDINEFNSLENVKLVTVAPEARGAEKFISECKAVVSLGHTVCDYETAVKAADAGAKCVTHIYNAMPPFHHREPSLIGAAVDKNLYVQVICDGLHIHKSVITSVYRTFGSDRMVLISDSVSPTGYIENGEYIFGGLKVIIKDCVARTESGALAGSTTNLFDCVKTAISFGIPVKEAFKMASETPAELMGINKGKLKEGYDADFIAVDNNLNLKKVIISGKVYK